LTRRLAPSGLALMIFEDHELRFDPDAPYIWHR
jgi:hypothetical protein